MATEVNTIIISNYAQKSKRINAQNFKICHIKTNMATIVIDAGHGGSDWGATRDGRMEKAEVLGLAMAVGRILEARGNNVIYTRQSDIFLTPGARATLANNQGADLFVSFHRDAFTNPSANGSSVLVHTNTSAANRACATQMAGRIATAGNFANRGVVNRNDLTVLNATNMPAILLEVGFLSNPQDNQRFDTRTSQIVNAIADGVSACLGQGTVTPPTPPQPPTSTNFTGMVTTTSGNLNVRSAPNTGAPVIGSLPNGSTVTILGEQNGWYRINFQGRDGWVSSQFVRLNVPGTVTTAGGNLNMRSSANATAPIIATIPNGTQIPITGISGDFFQIFFGGRTGWVSRNFVRT